MGFLDFFRPTWRHSNVEVRVEAIKRLRHDDLMTLVEVAKRDSDARVRRVAIKRIEDPKVLRELAQAESDTELRGITEARASELFLDAALAEGTPAMAALEQVTEARDLVTIAKRGASEAVRRSALTRIRDDKSLADVALRGDAQDVRIEAVGRITDVELLTDIAVRDESKPILLAAIEKLRDVDALKTVAKKAKSKAARAAAQERLPVEAAPAKAQVESSADRKGRKARLLQVCILAESHSRSSDWDAAAKGLQDAELQWDDIGGGNEDQALRKRFDDALKQFETRRRTAEENEVRETAARKQKREADARAQSEKRAAEEAEAKRVESKPAEPEVALAPVAAPAPVVPVVAAEAAPAPEPVPPSPEELARIAAKRAEDDARRAALKAENMKALTAACDKLESVLESADLKVLESALRTAQAAGKLRRSGDEPENLLRGRLVEAMTKAEAKADELREAERWKRWANVPALEKLCEEAEALAEVLLTAPDKRRAPSMLKELHERWRAVGPAPQEKSKPLWDRFKKATDTAHERCQEFFAKLDEDREGNQKKKEELAAQAEALAASTDWKDTGDKLKAMQDEWQKIGPVPREKGDELWNRFRGACDRFFEARKVTYDKNDHERAANLARKEKLCVEVEGLTGAPDRKAAVERVKSLFAEWSSVGPVPRELSDGLLARFKAACDKVMGDKPVVVPVADAVPVAAPTAVTAPHPAPIAAPAPVVAAPAPVVVAPAAAQVMAVQSAQIIAAPQPERPSEPVEERREPAPPPETKVEPEKPAAVDEGWE